MQITDTAETRFHWKCKHTWKQSAYNTMWCLIGCSIGDFGTIFFFQILNIHWSTIAIMILAIINGLITIDQETEVITQFDHYDYGLPGSGILIWHIKEPDENFLEK